MVQGFVHPEYLVETGWLTTHLDDPGVRVLDCSTHLPPLPDNSYYTVRPGRDEFLKEHIPGAAFAIRSRLEQHVQDFGSTSIVCTSPDGVLARYAASDLAQLLRREVHALEGGTNAWRAAGLPLETGESRMLDAPEDVYYKPYDHKAQIEAAMQDYLQWEVALLEQIGRDPDCRFRDYPRERP